MPTEIVKKPWGYEEIWAKTESYVGKKIHREKEETVYVVSGNLRLQFEDHARLMIQGESCHIPPGTIHRFCADRNNVDLIEVSTPQLSDVVRIEDDYGRDETN